MLKQSENRQRTGSAIPMIVLLLLGLLFFGVFALVTHIAPEGAITTKITLIFLGAYLLFSLTAGLFFLLKERKQRREEIIFETLNTKMHNMFKYAVGLPYAIADEQGRVRVVNSALQIILDAEDPFYRGSIVDFCGGVSLQDIIRVGQKGADYRTPLGKLTITTVESDNDAIPADTLPESSIDGAVVRLPDGGRYVARAYEMRLNDRTNYLVTFTDASELLDLREKMERDMPAVAYIDVDNLEELTQYTHANYRDASRKVDDILISFAADMNGFLREYERDRYIMLFSQEKLRLCEEDRFSALLDRIRDIRLGEYGIPVTVSVGISLDDCSMAEPRRQAPHLIWRSSAVATRWRCAVLRAFATTAVRPDPSSAAPRCSRAWWQAICSPRFPRQTTCSLWVTKILTLTRLAPRLVLRSSVCWQVFPPALLWTLTTPISALQPSV